MMQAMIIKRESIKQKLFRITPNRIPERTSSKIGMESLNTARNVKVRKVLIDNLQLKPKINEN
jgi:hypothetical protein